MNAASRPSFREMTYRQMLQYESELKKQMAAKQKEAKAELREKLSNMAEDFGFTIEELFPGVARTRRKAAPKNTIKFRNPDDPAQTWSGKGRRPQWFLEATSKKGLAPTELAV
jgi:DNA-binding protein H-NS